MANHCYSFDSSSSDYQNYQCFTSNKMKPNNLALLQSFQAISIASLMLIIIAVEIESTILIKMLMTLIL